METARSGACAAGLPDGRILITGGDGTDGPSSRGEIFQQPGKFTAVAPMSVNRSNHVCVAMDDGRVFVAGGRSAEGVYAIGGEIYDPRLNEWSVTGSMTLPRAGATATFLSKTGGVLIAGGENNGLVLASMELFNPADGSFTLVQSPLPWPRKQHTATLLNDGRVLIAGGTDGASSLASADIFDPVSGAVTPAGRMWAARAGHSATTLLDGRVLIAGGVNISRELASAELYDPAKGTFSVAANMRAARQGHLAFRLPDNNSVMILGGKAGGVATGTTELYIPWRNEFEPASGLTSPRAGSVGGPLGRKGLLMVAGGVNSSGALATAETVTFPTLATDQADYAPGTNVLVTGGGWQPGETVNLVFHETNGPDADVTYQAAADSSGNISNNQFVPDTHDYGVIFTLTATGLTSGLTAQTSFSDGAAMTGCSNGTTALSTNCAWVNGNLNSSKAHYLEGDSVPYKVSISGLTAGTHTVFDRMECNRQRQARPRLPHQL